MTLVILITIMLSTPTYKRPHRPIDYSITIDSQYFNHNEWLKYGRRMVEGWLN